MLRPRVPLVWLVAGWVLLGLVAAFVGSQLVTVWAGVGAILAMLAGVDALSLRGCRAMVQVKRELPGRFAQGVEQQVRLRLTHRGGRSIVLEIFDGLPSSGESEELPWRGRLETDHFVDVGYRVRLIQRGPVSFSQTRVLGYSVFGFWARHWLAGDEGESKVYPNYEPVVRFALLSMANRTAQMGIMRKNLRGSSREFRQLRDYHEGDSLSQIDWKASSRYREMIAREYEEQRNQTLIFMLDGGRRMRAMDGDRSQFDHCLNAVLLLSYVALKQGDQVGVLGFGGVESWLPPVKGAQAMTPILNHLYQAESTPEASDFQAASELLLGHQKRRSLVVMLSNLRGGDEREIIKPLELLRAKHLVTVATIRERDVLELLEHEIHSERDALNYSAAQFYLEGRQQVFSSLRQRNIAVVDSTANQFPIDLANHYLAIKNAGQL